MRYADDVNAVKTAVLESSGHTAIAVRKAAAARDLAALPENLRAYVDKVAKWAYKVTDEDVDALKAAGYTEDQIFEITAATAVGAALHRLDAGMRALKESAT
jgi:alkylhydroperoxidase family enzyme